MNFNPESVKREIILWLRELFPENVNAIVGTSGGKDSSIVLSLCVEALGKERVYAVLMPNGIQKDIEDSLDLVRFLDVKHINFNIGMIYEDFLGNLDQTFSEDLNEIFSALPDQLKINLAPRLRMTALYAIAAKLNGFVVGTSNLSEKYIGFFTKHGDGASDLNPIGDLTCTEVKAVGKLLLSDRFVDKTPADGLTEKTDEDRFGFTYDELDKYIRTGIIENQKSKELIDKMHQNSFHKINSIPIYKINS